MALTYTGPASWDDYVPTFEKLKKLNSSITFLDWCYEKKSFDKNSDFVACYNAIIAEKPTTAALEILLAIGAGAINGFVIFCIFASSNKKKVFDYILAGYCLINGLTCWDITCFHIQDVFGYWPLGKVASHIWSTYDNNINPTTAQTMFYCCYARLRSLQNPKGYENELLLKKPYVVMGLIWIVWLTYWGIVEGTIGNQPFTITVNYDPPWLVSLLNFPWVFFLCCNIVCTVIIGKFLFEKASKDKKKRSAKSKTLSESKSNKSGVNTQSSALATQSTLIETYSSLRSTMSKIGQYKVFTPERKFVIIMVTYIAQWSPPCFLCFTSSFITYDPLIYNGIYWLTYTVCLVDGCNIFFLNPNIKVPTKEDLKKLFKIK